MIINGHFGEFEILRQQKKRRWGIKAKTNCIVYQISKKWIPKIFVEEGILDRFGKQADKRRRYHLKTETVCTRVIQDKDKFLRKFNRQEAIFGDRLRQSIWALKGKNGHHERRKHLFEDAEEEIRYAADTVQKNKMKAKKQMLDEYNEG